MKHSLKYYFLRIWDFGPGFFVRYHFIGRRKGKTYKQNVIFDYIKNDLSKCGFDSRHESSLGTSMDSQPIWVCWWQGEHNMPLIVTACVDSIKNHANDHPIIFLHEGNISDYIVIPSIITEKRRKGIISLSHFSDYIRFSILSKYGGLWIDSTMYLTSDLPYYFPYFYTLKQDAKDDAYISNYRWSGFFIGGGQGNLLFVQLTNYLFHYWSRYSSLIDYFLFDFVIAALYETHDEIREMIDNTPFSNPNLHKLQPLLNTMYDKKDMRMLCDDTSFFKLSWKFKYATTTTDGNKTYFGHIIENNL